MVTFKIWVKNKVRSKAVEATKRELILRGTNFDALQPSELAYLINQAEKEIIQQWQQRGLLSVAALFGITVI